MESFVLGSCSSPLIVEARRRDVRSALSAITCSSRSHACIPKLEPFSRTKFERGVREPPLIQKCENELAGKYATPESYGDSRNLDVLNPVLWKDSKRCPALNYVLEQWFYVWILWCLFMRFWCVLFRLLLDARRRSILQLLEGIFRAEGTRSKSVWSAFLLESPYRIN